MKEAYDSQRVEGTWDLRKFIRKHKVSGRTLKPMAQWAYGVQNVVKTQEILPFKSSSAEVENALLSIAVINLKKSSGKNKSNNTNLLSYVDEDWTLISEQIRAIKPQIVICGNTWSLIRHKFPTESLTKVSDRAYLSEGTIYIDYWHPSNRAANKMSYYALCALVQLAIKNLNCDL